jgi:carbon monoxide dehydrogenase subunit G
MQFDGEFVVDGSPAEVWPYFNDPDILEDCAPGCKELSLESPSEIQASLEVGVGSVKPSFEVDGVVVECDEPRRLELQASGEASRNSFAVSAWQELADNGDGTTTVTWQADAEVSGVIASLGERALESVTDKLVADFFEDIESHVVEGTPAEAQFQAAGEEEVEAAEEAAAAASEGGPVEDLLALLGSLGDTAGDSDRRPDSLSLSAGVGLGLAVAVLWSLLRGGEDDAETADEQPEAGGGGRLRYLLVGLVAGVAGKALWDAYASDEAAPGGADQPTVQPAAEPAQQPSSPAEEQEESVTHDEPERGMIQDPLDRLD